MVQSPQTRRPKIALKVKLIGAVTRQLEAEGTRRIREMEDLR